MCILCRWELTDACLHEVLKHDNLGASKPISDYFCTRGCVQISFVKSIRHNYDVIFKGYV